MVFTADQDVPLYVSVHVTSVGFFPPPAIIAAFCVPPCPASYLATIKVFWADQAAPLYSSVKAETVSGPIINPPAAKPAF